MSPLFRNRQTAKPKDYSSLHREQRHQLDKSLGKLYSMKKINISWLFTILLTLFCRAASFTQPVHVAAAQTTTINDSCSQSALILASSSSQDSASTSTTTSANMQSLWFQHAITITAPSRGCHLITRDIQKAAGDDIGKIKIGMCNLFVQHTSASLTINENADPDVRRDMEVALNKIVPAQWNRDGTFRHTMEGDDDMPGHVKSSMMGVSLNIPIRDGRLALGTWQGMFLRV